MVTIAIANQKGGVGKTTIALALATAVADLVKRRVLFIDLDIQANGTVGLGQRPQPGIANWLLMGKPLEDTIIHVRDHLDLVPSNSLTEDANLSLANRSRITAIKDGLNRKKADYDYVIIDCPPNLSMITRTGIYAAKYVLTPVDCEFFALQGLVMLASIIREVQEQGSGAKWLGVVPNKWRDVTVHRKNIARLKEKFGRQGSRFVWDRLPLTTQIAKTQELGQSIWDCRDVDKRHQALWAAMVKRVLSYG